MCLSKGSKEALTVQIVNVTHVEGVERSLNSIVTHVTDKGRKITFVHNHSHVERVELIVEKKDIQIITSLIFNGFSIRKKFWKAVRFPTIPSMPCMLSMSKGSKVIFRPLRLHGIGWYGWKGLSLKIENPLNIKEVMEKCVCPFFQHNIIFRPFRHSIECSILCTM